MEKLSAIYTSEKENNIPSASPSVRELKPKERTSNIVELDPRTVMSGVITLASTPPRVSFFRRILGKKVGRGER